AFAEDCDRTAQFIQPGDHRKHDFYIAHDARTQNCAQLRLKDVNILETETDRTPAKEWIQLVGDIDCARGQFIAAEIKCSNNQGIWPDALCNFSISSVLFVLRRQSPSIQIEELGAIKPDALRAIGRYRANVVREFNVCR